MRLKIESPSTFDLDCWRDIKLTPSPPFLYKCVRESLILYEPRHEKTYFLLKCENETKCAVHVTAQLISAYVFATEIIQVCRIPKTVFFATRLIFNYNDKQPLQKGLSACLQCVGMGTLGCVKANSSIEMQSCRMFLFPIRARFHEQSLFAKYLHAFVSVFPNKCHLKCFKCLSILRNRYNPMKNRYRRL